MELDPLNDTDAYAYDTQSKLNQESKLGMGSLD